MNNLSKALELFVRDTVPAPPMDRFHMLLERMKEVSVPAKDERVKMWCDRIAAISAEGWDKLCAPFVPPKLGWAAPSQLASPLGEVKGRGQFASLVLSATGMQATTVTFAFPPTLDDDGTLSLWLFVPEGEALGSRTECDILVVDKASRRYVETAPRRVRLGTTVTLRIQIPSEFVAAWRSNWPASSPPTPPDPSHFPFTCFLA